MIAPNFSLGCGCK